MARGDGARTPRFPAAAQAWPSQAFAQALTKEIEGMGLAELPLDQGASQSGYVDASNLRAMLLTSTDEGPCIRAEVGVFFSEIIAGCSCGDEPEAIAAYCRLEIHIDKASADAVIRVLPE